MRLGSRKREIIVDLSRSNSSYKMNTDKFLWQNNTLSLKTCTLPVLAKEYKELYGKYKVFPLLNKYGDHCFLFQNLTSLKVNSQLAKFGSKLMGSSISREFP